MLASPRVLVLNKQRAEIQLGQRLGYRNTVTNLTSSLQTVQFLSVGTLLTLRPYVSSDGMVRLEIHPERSSGALDSQGIPQTNTSELTTNILVPDGSTIAIGGLIDKSTNVSQEGVLGLSTLPIVGPLFRNRNIQEQKTELIVLLTPRIIARHAMPQPQPGVSPVGPLGVPNTGPMPGPPDPALIPPLAVAPGAPAPIGVVPPPAAADPMVLGQRYLEQTGSAPPTLPLARQARDAAAPDRDASLNPAAYRPPSSTPPRPALLDPSSPPADPSSYTSTAAPFDDGYQPGDLTRTVFHRLSRRFGSRGATPPRPPATTTLVRPGTAPSRPAAATAHPRAVVAPQPAPAAPQAVDGAAVDPADDRPRTGRCSDVPWPLRAAAVAPLSLRAGRPRSGPSRPGRAADRRAGILRSVRRSRSGGPTRPRR